jgi:hypothetical protein
VLELDDAIRKHVGEAAKTAKRYAQLSSSDRRAVVSFLSSLTASSKPKAKRPTPGAPKPPPGPALAAKVF